MAKKVIKKRISKTKIVFLIISLLLFAVGYFLGNMYELPSKEEEKEPIVAVYEPLTLTKDVSVASIIIPAVDKIEMAIVLLLK